MDNYERYFRYYFLTLQTLDEESLERFFQRNFDEFLLRESDLKLNGVKVDDSKRREIVGSFIASQFNTGDTIYLGEKNDILETTGIEITEETFLERSVSLIPNETNTFKNAKLIEKIKAYRRFIKDKLVSNKNRLSHRLEALIYKYKAEAKYIPNVFYPAEIQKKFGAKRKQAIYTIWNDKGDTYRAATKKELEIIIPYLTDYPNAQKAAINDLDQLS